MHGGSEVEKNRTYGSKSDKAGWRIGSVEVRGTITMSSDMVFLFDAEYAKLRVYKKIQQTRRWCPMTTNNEPNRLAKEKSPYLLQHAYNPVDWYPWTEEAFEKAKRENKPVFLSIGYS